MDLRDIANHPVSRIEWRDVNSLQGNSYNPNIVLDPELKLLKLSILTQGWIQPILVNIEPGASEGDTLEIIDGFHRYRLTKTDKDVFALTGGLVPCVDMHLTKPERMMLTIRINRAKGNHVAIRMHEIVAELFNGHGYSVAQIGQGIGADKHEVETLLQQDIFQKKDVANVPYSKAWVPRAGRGKA